MSRSLSRTIAIGFAAFVVMPTLTTSACASSDESQGVFTPNDAGKDVKATGGSGGITDSGTGGSKGGTGGTGGTATGGKGGTGGTGGGTCNPTTCPTPAPPAQKCCVTANGPCGVDYKQGAGCQMPSSGDI